MTFSIPSGADSPEELRTCLRDLLGLLGLPALWSSREPRETVRMLASTLVEILWLDVCLVSTAFHVQEEPIMALYANGRAIDPGQATEWKAFCASPDPRYQGLQIGEEETACGKLRVVRFSLAYYGHAGHIVVGAARNGFPRPTELVLLRSAASLAAGGLRSATLMAERERAARAKDEFLAMLGHELRNPLAPIVAALDLMKMKAGGTLNQEQTIVARQVKHLTALVDDLLDITRITSGKIELDREVTEVATVVGAAVEISRPLIESRRHRLTIDVPAAGCPVDVDTRRLTQVLSNILVNAAKYTEPGGRISMAAERTADGVSIKVTDNGNGIEPALLPRVFDLFQQGAVSIDRSGGGLGIGLALVNALVKLHGGQVKAESKGAGMGSTFTVLLPLARKAEDSSEPAASLPLPGSQNGSRILLVDDNKDAADILAELLRTLGHEVFVEYSPLAALEACDKLAPRILILDIGLPVMSGYELARCIRKRYANATPRIIAVTGYGQMQDRARSYEAGIDVHLTKPITMPVLLPHLQLPD